MTDKRELVCFIASPSGVESERKACSDIATEINIGLGNMLKASYQVVKCETHSYPNMGKDGQSVLNDQLHPENADVVVCIIGERYGTPTGRATSGTEEEFRRARERWEKDKGNKIHVFFKSEKTWSADVSEEDRTKIAMFRDEMKMCGLFAQYEDIEDFKSCLRRCLEADMWELSRFKSMPRQTVNAAPAKSEDVCSHNSGNEDLHSAAHLKLPEVEWDAPVLHVVGIVPDEKDQLGLFAFVKAKIESVGKEPLVNLCSRCVIMDKEGLPLLGCACSYEGVKLRAKDKIRALFFAHIKNLSVAKRFLEALLRRDPLYMDIRVDYQNLLACNFKYKKSYYLDSPSSASRIRFQALAEMIADGWTCASIEQEAEKSFLRGLQDMVFNCKDTFVHEFAMGVLQNKMLEVGPERKVEYDAFVDECHKLIDENVLPVRNAQTSFAIPINNE